MTPSSPSPHDPLPEKPLAGAGRAPLHQDLATARDERRGGISIQTLTVAAAASAIASFTVSRIWGAGTVVSAALTPVLVALASEFLRRPVDHVSASAQRVVPVVAPALVRPSTARGQAPPAPTRVQDGAPGARRPPAPGEPTAPPSPPPAQADWAPVSYADPPAPAFRPRWRLVLMTGFLAFAIVVGFFTIPDLILGHSITGAGGSTTFFSGSGSTAPSTRTVTVQTTTTPTTTAAPQQQTVTVTVPTTTDTAPQQTTPPTDTTQTTPTTPTTQSAPTTPTTPGGP